MQVAKYWRNKKLRYRLARDGRFRRRALAEAVLERDAVVSRKTAVKPLLELAVK